MPMKPCLDCKRLHRNPSRCDTCTTAYQRRRDAQRGSSAQRGYGSAWRKARTTVMERHLVESGAVCPGFGVPAHAADPAALTVDHIRPKAKGEGDSPDNLRVLCRACNSRKRDREHPAPYLL